MHALRLVLAHAVRDQLDLVGEVVVHDAVGVRGVLGDLAQRGSRVAELAQRLQRGGGELAPALLELVDGGVAWLAAVLGAMAAKRNGGS